MRRSDRLLGTGLGLLHRLSSRTFRYRAVFPDGTRLDPRTYPFAGSIFALCERDTLALAPVIAGAGLTVLVALGRDGDRTTAFLRALGCRAVRGSSGRGGSAALAALLRALRQHGGAAGIVVDGPLGPAGQAKGGTVALGLRSGLPIRALGAAACHRLVFPRTWSGIYLPLPLARVVVACDEALPMPATRGPGVVAPLAAALSERLAAMRELAATTLAGDRGAAGRRGPVGEVGGRDGNSVSVACASGREGG